MAEHESTPGSGATGSAEASAGAERLREVMREGFTLMLGAANWMFEQGDRLMGTWMEQGKVTREEGRRKFDDFAARTRKTGEDWGRAVSDRVRSATSSVPVASREQVASLERRVEELTRQIEDMKAASHSQPSSEGRGKAR